MSSSRSSTDPATTSTASSPCVADSFDGDEQPTRPGDTVPTATRLSSIERDHPVLTVLAGINAGQLFTLDRDESSIGRSKDADVRVDGAGVSRKHGRIVRKDGCHVLEDLGATHGVFVNGERVERAILQSGDRIQLGPALVLRFALISAEEKALARRLYEGSTRDALTGTYNRKYFEERSAEEIAYAKRHKTHLGLVLVDLDHFKRINDAHGHLAGDIVLRIVAAQLQRILRREDVLARYGGEEFVVIVRGIEHRNVGILAERLRRAVETLEIPLQSDSLRVTVSVGIATLAERETTPTFDALVQLADERLYAAKSAGRNRVCC